VLQIQDEARLTLQEDLNWFVASLLPNDVTTKVQIREGRVVPEILKMAAELERPLIVMGTHGRSGFEHLILGSITEKVLRKASDPVLAVPPGADGEALNLRRVICALDFSAASTDALAFGQWLAQPAAANLSLLHVLDWPFGEPKGPGPVLTLRDNLEAEAKSQLDKMPVATPVKIAERVVRTGKPGPEIAAFARERGADLIVMGVSGHGAVNRAMLGSTAHAVLRDAPCAVLTVPARGAAD
jgi:nucleotide-binding universal stress UspA family protein